MLSWWGQLSKLAKSIFILLLVVLVIGLGYVLNSFYPINQFFLNNRATIYTPSGTPIEFKITSNLNKYTIAENLNQEAMKLVLEAFEYGITWEKFYNPKGSKPINPTTIIFAFEDITQLDDAQQLNLFDTVRQDGTLTKGADTIYDEQARTFTYTVYVDQSYLVRLNGIDQDNIFTNSIIRALYLSSGLNVNSGDPDSFGIHARKAYQTLNDENLNLFKMRLSLLDKSALASFAVNTKYKIDNFSFVQNVFAQDYCNGGYGCEYQGWTNCECDVPGYSCNEDDTACGPGGLGQCSCDPTCGPGYQDFNCNAETEAACLSEGTSCPSGDQYCGTPSYENCSYNPPSGGEGCPTGTYWCGGCIWSCIPDSQNCQQRIDNECSTQPPPTGDPQTWYGCVGNSCSGTTWGSESECEANADSCQQGSCPNCGGGQLWSACLNPAACNRYAYSSQAECEADAADGSVYNCVAGECVGCGGGQNWNNGARYFFMFEDINEDGRWSPNGELRISPLDWCMRDGTAPWYYYPYGANTHSLSSQTAIGLPPNSIRMYFDENGYSDPQQGYPESAYTDGLCRIDNTEQQTSYTADWQVEEFTCFREDYGTDGKLCDLLEYTDPNDPDIGYRYPDVGNGNGLCEGNFQLKEGPLYRMRADSDWYIAELELPDGWRISEGTLELWDSLSAFGAYSVGMNGRIRINFFIDGHSTQPYTCSGFGSIGLKRDYEKTCSVGSSTTSVVNNESFIVNTSAYSNAPYSESNNLYMVKLSDTDPSQSVPMDTAPPNTTFYPNNGGQNYYLFNNINCVTGAGNPECVDSVYLSNIEPGTYQFFCQMPSNHPEDDNPWCSGNPLCDHHGGTTNCSGWEACNIPDDNVTVDVSCDSGTPTMSVSLTSPSAYSANNYNMTGENEITVWWNETQNFAEYYDIKIINRSVFNGQPVTQARINAANCNNSNVLCINDLDSAWNFGYYNPSSGLITPSTVTNAVVGPYSGAAIGDQVTIAARGTNTSCNTETGNWAWTNANFKGDIQTQARVINNNDINGACTVANSSLASFGSQQAYSAENSDESTSVNSSIANYEFQNLSFTAASWNNNYELELQLNNSDPSNSYICAACSGSGETCHPAQVAGNTNRPAPSTVNTHFYLVNYDLSNGPWMQWQDGLAYGGTGITSEISNACSGSCRPFMARGSSVASAGIPISGSGSGSINPGDGQESERNSGQGEFALGQNFGIEVKDYDYYTNQIELTGNPIPGLINNFNTQIRDTSNSFEIEDATIFHRTGTLDLQWNGGSGRWSVGSNDKYIVFVDGNLNVSALPGQRLIDVAEGGFLAFIVNGTITFNNSVGHTVSEASPPENINSEAQTNVEGVFIGDNIVIAGNSGDSSPDRKFVGAGTFVGWNGIDFERSYDDGSLGMALHNNSPTELIFYRPDFVINAPRVLEETTLIWQQSN